MGTGSPFWGWANALAGFSSDTATCPYPTYGNYANLQMAQMAQQQQAQVNPGHYWETPSQREHDRRKRQELEDLVKKEILTLPPDPPPKPDPFRQLCNHDFHGLLDKFKGMRDGTATA